MDASGIVGIVTGCLIAVAAFLPKLLDYLNGRSAVYRTDADAERRARLEDEAVRRDQERADRDAERADAERLRQEYRDQVGKQVNYLKGEMSSLRRDMGKLRDAYAAAEAAKIQSQMREDECRRGMKDLQDVNARLLQRVTDLEAKVARMSASHAPGPGP